jgi:hypothetical protein
MIAHEKNPPGGGVVRLRTPIKDFLLGSIGAAADGIGQDFAETKVNPTFVSAPVAPLGWYVAIGELALGGTGLLVSHLSRDDTYYEIGEGFGLPGVRDTFAALTHTVRRYMAKGAAAPAAPTQVLRTQIQQAPQTRLAGSALGLGGL